MTLPRVGSRVLAPGNQLQEEQTFPEWFLWDWLCAERSHIPSVNLHNIDK